MSDYISRQAAIDILSQYPFEKVVNCISILEEMPPADVPDVVYCKECKYAQVADLNDEQDGYTCRFHRGSIWFSGCYCSWGERKTE